MIKTTHEDKNGNNTDFKSCKKGNSIIVDGREIHGVTDDIPTNITVPLIIQSELGVVLNGEFTVSKRDYEYYEKAHEDLKRLHNIKRSKYIKLGIEVSDELDKTLFEESVREIAMANYYNGERK